jgi:hypothetical protein
MKQLTTARYFCLSASLLTLTGLIGLIGLTTLSAQPFERAQASASQPSGTLWLWQKGRVSGLRGPQHKACNTLLREAGAELSVALMEQTGARLISDGQSIPCADEVCLEARRETMGARVTLQLNGTCTSSALQLEAIITSQGAPMLSYRATVSRTRPREAVQAGRALATQLTAGPKPRPQPTPPKRWRLGIGALGALGQLRDAELSTLGVSLSWALKSKSAPYELNVALAHTFSESEREQSTLSSLSVGGRWLLSTSRFTPMLGLSLAGYDRRARTRLDSRQPEGEMWLLERRELRYEEQRGVSALLEVGALWRGSTLELEAVARLTPLTLLPLQSGAEWSALFGLRW